MAVFLVSLYLFGHFCNCILWCWRSSFIVVHSADYFGEAELVAKDWIVFVELGGYSGYAYYFVIYVVELGDCFGGHYFSLCFVSFLRYVDFF